VTAGTELVTAMDNNVVPLLRYPADLDSIVVPELLLPRHLRDDDAA
jgi:hypothetical protein